MSFVLKTSEKLVDRYIWETIVSEFPLSDSQPAYQSGRSTDTALLLYFFNFGKDCES